MTGDNGAPAEPAWTEMPADLKSQLLHFIENYQVPKSELDGPCVWYDIETKRCKHHESRPRVCRDFRVGSKGCRDWRAAYAINDAV